jgi:hypothetical protein
MVPHHRGLRAQLTSVVLRAGWSQHHEDLASTRPTRALPVRVMAPCRRDRPPLCSAGVQPRLDHQLCRHVRARQIIQFAHHRHRHGDVTARPAPSAPETSHRPSGLSPSPTVLPATCGLHRVDVFPEGGLRRVVIKGLLLHTVYLLFEVWQYQTARVRCLPAPAGHAGQRL